MRARDSRIFALACAYFVLAIVANAVSWGARVDDRLLEYRHWDYGWELLLPWEASRGRWSGWDFVYPIGPLWQLLAYLPSAFGEFSARRAITGLHLAFPLLSLGVAVVIALRSSTAWRDRWLVLVPLALLGLHDDVRSARGLLPLAALWVFLPREGAPATWSRAFVSAGLLSASGWLSLDAGLLGLFGLAAAGATSAALALDRRAELARLGRTLAAWVGCQAAFALVLAASGGSIVRYVRGAFGITSAYGTTMLLQAEGFSPKKVAFFVALALATLWFVARGRGRDAVAAAWLAGTTPFLARALLRSDAEHVYAALLPLVAVLFLIAVRHRRERPALAAYTALIGLVFVLGWFGAHMGRSNAWDPRGFARASAALSGAPSPEHYRGDFRRLEEWLLARKAEGVRCVGLPASKVALHAITGVPGPTAMSLGWSAPLQREMAEAVRRERCPLYVQEIVSFDEGSWGFGEYLLALSELYEPVEPLGADLWVTRLRADSRPLARTPLALAERGSAVLFVPGEVSHRFARPVPWDRALAIRYAFEVPWLARLFGGVPALEAQLYAGDEPLGSPMSVPYPTLGTHTTLLPVDAAVAEQRFVAGVAPRSTRAADRIVVRARGSKLSPAMVTFALLELEEVRAVSGERAPRAACTSSADLLAAARGPGAFFRTATPRVEGDTLALDPNRFPEPDAEVFFPLVPCADACLYAELGVASGDEDSDGVEFDVHVIDGYERPRLVAWHARAGHAPKPLELPLADWAGRDVLVRFGTRSGPTLRGDRARIHRPRIAPCTARQNLVVAFHQGSHRVERGSVAVSGDTVRLAPAGLGEPPTDVRLPLQVARGSCLALDVRAEEPPPDAGRIGVDVGIVEADLVLRLARPELSASDPPQSLRDMPLERFWGKRVELRLAAWSLDERAAPTAVVAGARVHRCGDGAPWGFGGR